MKNIIITIFTLGMSLAISAQVAIGKDTPLEGAILDFENPAMGGIALPKIITLDGATVPGTMYFDTADSKVKFKLVAGDLDLNNKNTSSPFDTTQEGYNNLVETAEINGTIMGAEESNIPGVLILETTEMALVIPNVANLITDIKSPEPGMIAYDTLTNLLCVFDGTQWAFWGKHGVNGLNNQ